MAQIIQYKDRVEDSSVYPVTVATAVYMNDETTESPTLDKVIARKVDSINVMDDASLAGTEEYVYVVTVEQELSDKQKEIVLDNLGIYDRLINLENNVNANTITLNAKQNRLVHDDPTNVSRIGNIKTINGVNILGPGNVNIVAYDNIVGVDNVFDIDSSNAISNSVVSKGFKDFRDTIVYEKGTGEHSAVLKNSGSDANGDYSHAEGNITKAKGEASHAEGYDTYANGTSSHAEGEGTVANAQASHAEGSSTQANDLSSHAEGSSTQANGESSHAEGNGTQAKGYSSHAEGHSTEAIGDCSHAEGEDTEAIGNGSHAEGVGTKAKGEASHAAGNSSIAVGDYSSAMGEQVVAQNKSECVVGSFNAYDIKNSMFTVGIGTGNGNRKNGFVVTRDKVHQLIDGVLSIISIASFEEIDSVTNWYNDTDSEDDSINN